MENRDPDQPFSGIHQSQSGNSNSLFVDADTSATGASATTFETSASQEDAACLDASLAVDMALYQTELDHASSTSVPPQYQNAVACAEAAVNAYRKASAMAADSNVSRRSLKRALRSARVSWQRAADLVDLMRSRLDFPNDWAEAVAKLDQLLETCSTFDAYLCSP